MRVFDRAIRGAKALHGSVRKDAQPHNSIVRSVGIGEPSPTSIFCEISRRGIEAKKQGVYHLALLANFVFRHPTYDSIVYSSASLDSAIPLAVEDMIIRSLSSILSSKLSSCLRRVVLISFLFEKKN